MQSGINSCLEWHLFYHIKRSWLLEKPVVVYELRRCISWGLPSLFLSQIWNCFQLSQFTKVGNCRSLLDRKLKCLNKWKILLVMNFSLSFWREILLLCIVLRLSFDKGRIFWKDMWLEFYSFPWKCLYQILESHSLLVMC